MKIIKELADVRSHRGVLFQKRRNATLRSNGKTTARESVVTGPRSRSFAIRTVSGRNMLSEEVVQVGSLCEFIFQLDKAWFSVFGGGSV